MANNIDVKDAADVTKTMATVEGSGSVHTPKISTHQDVITSSFTRPANTTAYTAGDAVNDSTSAPTSLSFAGATRVNGGTAKVVGAVLYISGTPPGTPANFNLLLFDIDPTDTNDNAALATSDGDMDNCIAVIPFVGAFPFYAATTINMIYHWEGSKLIKADASSTTIYGQLQAQSGYTMGANSDVFQVKLAVEQA